LMPPPSPGPSPGWREPTPAGLQILGRLVEAGRVRIDEMLDGWEPNQHPELAELVNSISREFLLDVRVPDPARAPAEAP